MAATRGVGDCLFGGRHHVRRCAEAWWGRAANVLQSGKLLTIDYGLETEQFFAPERNQGTLRAYYRHHLTTDLLANLGEQDLTAQVNFTRIRAAGE